MKRTVGLASLFFAFAAYALLFNPWTASRFPKTGPAAFLLSPQTFFLLASAVIWRVRRPLPRDIGVSFRRWPADVALGVALGLAPAVIVLFLVSLGSLSTGVSLFEGPRHALRLGVNDVWLLFVLAPVSEELFFRGFLLRALRETYPAWVAVVASSVIFMAGHGGFAPGPLALGLITAPIVLRTGSLLPGIVFHSVSNAYVPLLMTGLPGLYERLSFLFR